MKMSADRVSILNITKSKIQSCLAPIADTLPEKFVDFNGVFALFGNESLRE